MQDYVNKLVVLILLVHILQPKPLYHVREKYHNFIKACNNRKWKKEHYSKKKPQPPKPTYLSKSKLRARFITTIPERCVIRKKD